MLVEVVLRRSLFHLSGTKHVSEYSLLQAGVRDIRSQGIGADRPLLHAPYLLRRVRRVHLEGDPQDLDPSVKF